MEDPVMPAPVALPEPTPKPFVRRMTAHEPDGTLVELEIHHNAAEL